MSNVPMPTKGGTANAWHVCVLAIQRKNPLLGKPIKCNAQLRADFTACWLFNYARIRGHYIACMFALGSGRIPSASRMPQRIAFLSEIALIVAGPH